ncbi:MAG TPA: DUF2510 domain-containing protein [Rhodopila sp.]|nr:DUF2510 domain-containing protein [Rhodopila sp.]
MTQPAGWYTDNTDPLSERWWDGQRWTDATRQAAGQPPAAPPTIPPAKRRRRWPWIAAAAFVLLVIISVATKGSSKKTAAASSPAPEASTTHAAAPAHTTQAAASESSPTITAPPPAPKLTAEQKYVEAIKSDADQVQIDVQLVQVTVNQVSNGAAGFDVNTLAVEAQKAHDDLANIKDDFVAHDEPGSLRDQVAAAYDAINSFKNSMGTIVAYCGDQNPATLARFTSQYGQALPEWNDAITQIWAKAGASQPPTI